MSLLDFLGETQLDWFKNQGNEFSVGYRRCAGKIGLTNEEEGKRGAWVEKRVNLFKTLLELGASIDLLSPLTPRTSQELESKEYVKNDILVLEFSGTNLQFYGKDWNTTFEIIKKHRGQVWFVNDDPDLPFLWNLLPDENWSRWTVIANAVNTDAVRDTLKCPEGVKVVDVPMISVPEFLPYEAQNKNGRAIYIGRADGRTKYFTEYSKSTKLDIAGKDSEWAKFPEFKLLDVPLQRDRRAFYSGYSACLAVFDKKHLACGWRTGRAYHSLSGGTPVIIPQPNAGLSWAEVAATAAELDAAVSGMTEETFNTQKKFVLKEAGKAKYIYASLIRH